MEFYSLNEDVYLVNGIARSAVYDLRNERLFSLSEKTRELIERIYEYPCEEVGRSCDERVFLDALLNLQVLVKTNIRKPPKDIRELSKPLRQKFAWIEVTRQCNLSCTFCYEGSDPTCLEKMTFDDFKIVVDNLKEHGIERIQFIGGEPMILKNLLKDMILYARPYFNFIEVYTNGTTINDNWCEFFKENNIYIATSIHSYLSEEHDKITQVNGSHRRVERAQKLLEKYNIPYRIGTVRTKGCDVGTPSEDAPYHLAPKMPKASGRADYLAYDFEMFKIKAIKKESKSQPISKEFIIRSVSGHQCFNKDIYVSAELDIYPCVMERRKTYGNLLENRLKDIVTDSITKLTKDYIDGCKGCEYRYGCFDCRPDSNGKHFLSKPWYCSYDPSKGEWRDLKEMFNKLSGSAKLQAIPILVK